MESSALGFSGWNRAPVAVSGGTEVRSFEPLIPNERSRSRIGRDGWKRGKRWQQQVSSAAFRSRIGQLSEALDGIQTCHHFSRSGLYMGITRVKAGTSSSSDESTSTEMHNASISNLSSQEVDESDGQVYQRSKIVGGLSSSLCLSALMYYSGPAYATESRTMNPVYGDLGAVLEVGVQLLYLGALLVLLGVGSYMVVRQVLIKRELETAAKELQDRVRSGEASSLEYFELGAVMLRKKFYMVARKHLNDAIKKWDGSEQDLAQVYNALGYSFYSEGKIDLAIMNYEKAVKLQPMYVTAWNNLADGYETQNNYVKALEAYEEALQFDPNNKVASAKRDQIKKRVEKFQGISSNKKT